MKEKIYFVDCGILTETNKLRETLLAFNTEEKAYNYARRYVKENKPTSYVIISKDKVKLKNEKQSYLDFYKGLDVNKIVLFQYKDIKGKIHTFINKNSTVY